MGRHSRQQGKSRSRLNTGREAVRKNWDPRTNFTKQEPKGWAECQCGWDALTDSESDARIISVCHVLVKHPEEYQRATGKDPERMRREYAEHISRFASMR